MSISSGIIYLLFVIFGITKIAKGAVPSIIFTGMAYTWASTWYVFIIAGICIMWSFGSPAPVIEEIVTANHLQRRYGCLFDGIGILLIAIGFITLGRSMLF